MIKTPTADDIDWINNCMAHRNLPPEMRVSLMETRDIALLRQQLDEYNYKRQLKYGDANKRA